MKVNKKLRYIKYIVNFLLVIAFVLIQPYAGVEAAKSSVDKSPPSTPNNLVSTAISETSVSLKWSASYDKKGSVTYLVYKNSILFVSTGSTSCTVII